MVDTDTILFVLTFVILVVFFILGTLELWDTNWFMFGPSENLEFFNAKIDTSMKYFGVLVFLLIIHVINAIGEFHVDSWFTSHVHGIFYQKYHPGYLFRMASCWRVYKMTLFLIQIHIAMSQLDIWLFALLFDLLAYGALISRAVNKKDDLCFTDDEIRRLKLIAKD
ncbi:MAG: hypothetical protein CL881_03895 [Dehalococcoidia bacterium]|nr:hypothetical protein [Dehalococcoidia bacterium]